MKFIKNILLGILVLSLLSCSYFIHKKERITKTGLIIKNGLYQLDTNIILSNLNLPPLLEKLESSEITEKRSVSYLPFNVKLFLDSLTHENFLIANPEEEWNITCISDENLPDRQLVFLGLGKDVILLAYLTGGIGVSEHVLIIKTENSKIVDFWSGLVSRGLNDKDKILEYLNDNIDKEYKLNSSFIYLK
ncbi:MAG: hypothetical protein JNJ85_02495 [Candidatus Kapabacteria bacterium]|nr:hypothetical protein [Candidatus Kapabacteria bacterium]